MVQGVQAPFLTVVGTYHTGERIDLESPKTKGMYSSQLASLSHHPGSLFLADNVKLPISGSFGVTWCVLKLENLQLENLGIGDDGGMRKRAVGLYNL